MHPAASNVQTNKEALDATTSQLCRLQSAPSAIPFFICQQCLVRRGLGTSHSRRRRDTAVSAALCPKLPFMNSAVVSSSLSASVSAVRSHQARLRH